MKQTTSDVVGRCSCSVTVYILLAGKSSCACTCSKVLPNVSSAMVGNRFALLHCRICHDVTFRFQGHLYRHYAIKHFQEELLEKHKFRLPFKSCGYEDQANAKEPKSWSIPTLHPEMKEKLAIHIATNRRGAVEEILEEKDQEEILRTASKSDLQMEKYQSPAAIATMPVSWLKKPFNKLQSQCSFQPKVIIFLLQFISTALQVNQTYSRRNI